MLFQRFPEVFASYPRYTMQLYFATIFEMLTHQIAFLTISMQSVFFILLKGYQIQHITFLVKKILQGCHHPASNKDSRLLITDPIYLGFEFNKVHFQQSNLFFKTSIQTNRINFTIHLKASANTDMCLV